MNAGDERFTPGPWEIADSGDERYINVDNVRDGEHEWIIARVWNDVDELHECAEANAKLIASAPSLHRERETLVSALRLCIEAFGKINLGLLDKDIGMFVYDAELESRRVLSQVKEGH